MSRLKILFLVIILLFSYCSQRDLSTPSSRLVGHWMRIYEITQEDVQKEVELYRLLGDTLSEPLLQAGVYETHLYYDKIDAKTQMGVFIMLDAGRKAIHQYKILTEQVDGKQLRMILLFGSGDSINAEFSINEDGLMLIRTYFDPLIDITDTLQYVDNKTEP